MWLFYVLAFNSAYLMYALLSRAWLKASDNQRVFSFIWSFIASLFAIILLLVNYKGLIKDIHEINMSLTALILIAIAIIIYGIVMRITFVIDKHLEASVRTVLETLGTVLAFFLSIVIYKEPYNFPKIIAFGVILLGNLLLIRKFKLHNTQKRILLYTLLVNICLVVAGLIDSFIIKKLSINIFLYNAILWIGPTFFVFLPKISMEQIKQELRLVALPKVTILATLAFVGYFFSLKSYQTGSVSLIIAISASRPVIVNFLSYFTLKEKEHFIYKLIIAVLVSISIYILQAS